MKTVFITGVKREMGLGNAFIRQYLSEGYTVFASARDVEQEYLRLLKSEWGDKLYLIPMDVTKVLDVKAAVQAVREVTPTLDILISNATAASALGGKPIDDGMDIEDALNSYDVNALGFIRLVQQFLEMFTEGSSAVAISSESGSMGDCWRDSDIDYGMAKAALNFACVTLQRRLGKRGIRVLSIHPGWVQTRPAPPKANLTPEESALSIFNTIASPPPFNEKGNTGVYMNYDGSLKVF
ncbi:MAG: SDR family oxidoreductase [Oscillospiraceae bacterium]|jgi:NAD(P)-dependent dehydrogenase (short-subunit alcohol dehydrogenase family)|nr:SDR family oxidoreductase [Oscillospiraceae bacterium]